MVPESSDLSWSRNSVILQMGEIPSSIVKKPKKTSYGSADNTQPALACCNLYFTPTDTVRYDLWSLFHKYS